MLKGVLATLVIAFVLWRYTKRAYRKPKSKMNEKRCAVVRETWFKF